jgi:hypothetical protein
MGKSSKRKWENRIKVALTSKQQNPWYESNLLWGSLGLTAAIVLTVAAAMVKDLRWVLWIAWLCSWPTVWLITKNISSRNGKIAGVVFGVGIMGAFLYKVNLWLEPQTDLAKAPQALNPFSPKDVEDASKKGATEALKDFVSKFKPDQSKTAPPSSANSDSFREQLPDIVYFTFGGRGITVGVPVKDLKTTTLFRLGGFVPVKLAFENGILYCDVTLWGGKNSPPVEVKHNNFVVRPAGWDRNFTSNALEVVNERGIPIFQLIRKTPSHYVLMGIIASSGQVLVGTETEVWHNPPSIPPDYLKPLFKYPSWKYLGQYANQ